jgi:YD repeat-containing protein
VISTSTGNQVSSGKGGAWNLSQVTATPPAGAAFASIGVSAFNNTDDVLKVDGAQWDYQYVAPPVTGVVETQYTYDVSGNVLQKATADTSASTGKADTESWTYDAYGKVLSHTDLNKSTYTYTYDANTQWLLKESDNWTAAGQGQVLPAYVSGPAAATTLNTGTRTYYASGLLKSLTYADGSVYLYTYDAAGNKTREEATTHDGNNNVVHVITATTYDSHNRIATVIETNVVGTTNTVTMTLSYSYDAVGNRREVKTVNGATTLIDAYYTYDADNRVVISNGILSGGNIVIATPGTVNTSDAHIQCDQRQRDGAEICVQQPEPAGDGHVRGK